MDYTMSNELESDELDSQPIEFTIDPMTFAARFKWARERAGVTQQQIADHCTISNRTISAWEQGVAKHIISDNLYCVADFIGVNPRWLATGKGTPDGEESIGAEFAKLPLEQQEAVRALISTLKR